MAQPAGDLHAQAFVHVALPAQAQLLLFGGLAGVEGRGLRRGLARVGGELLGRQPQRVVGRLALHLQHGHELLPRRAQLPARLGETALARAVGAPAVTLRDLRRQAHRLTLGGQAVQAHAGLAQAEGAQRQRGLRAVFGRPAALQRDDAAAGAAVQRRERAAQHLQRGGVGDQPVAQLALAVGRAGRDAVGHQPQPAHAEAGAGTVAAAGQLQVLRVVAAVGGVDAGQARQRAGQRLGRVLRLRITGQRGGGYALHGQRGGSGAAVQHDGVELDRLCGCGERGKKEEAHGWFFVTGRAWQGACRDVAPAGDLLFERPKRRQKVAPEPPGP